MHTVDLKSARKAQESICTDYAFPDGTSIHANEKEGRFYALLNAH